MKTLAGRLIDPPRIRLDSSRKILNDLKKLEQWLLDQAKEEAILRGDNYFLLLIQNEVAGKLPQATKDSLNLYLFGDLNH